MDQTEKATDQPRAHVRQHYYLERYAIIAPGRNKRPRQFDDYKPGIKKSAGQHPIEDSPSLMEIPDENGNWQVKVVANAYPAFTPDNEQARGTQEIVLESAGTGNSFGELHVNNIETIINAYQQRVRDLGQRYNYISIFKNHGYYSGATLDHTHSQIVASDLVPPDVAYERRVLTEYQHAHGSSPMCDVVRWELNNRVRVIAHTRYMTTICPYASQFPLEAWIIPNRQVHSLTDLNDEEVHSIADHLKGISSALAGNGIDFNYHVQEPVPDSYNHTFIKIVPRITIYGGFEYNTGLYINSITPEYATEWYQKHVKTPDAV